jgi:multidrug efflux pump
MKEISSALIGIATVLSAVFLPMAFFGGSSGIIYRQFSITIVSSMVLSVIIALVLTPALCASFLKPVEHKTKGFFGWFNRIYDRFQNNYESKVGTISKRPVRFMFIYAVIVGGMIFLFGKLPASFLPMEDQGDVMLQYTLPSGATMSRTDIVGKEVQNYFLQNEEKNTKYIFTISGFNFSGSAQNAGMAFVALKDWKERVGVENSASTIANRAMMNLSGIKDAKIFALTPPAISELGQSSGFSLNLQAVAGTSREKLKEYRDIVIQEANKNPMLTAVRANELKEMPQLRIDIDQQKASALGVSLADINSTISTAWGGNYVNDFVDRGRVKKVYVQGDMNARANPDDLNKWFVRSENGTMTPFSSFASTRWSYGPDSLGRYNGLTSYEIQGSAALGSSSGAAMSEMERIVSELPGGTIYSWSGLSYQEKLSQGKTGILYAVSILVVFLCLAALYESWSIPLSVIMVIPLGIIGAVVAAMFRGLENDIYFQVALLTTIGLSAKNAILIVEFAEMYYREGKGIIESAIAGASARLRPIIMTSLAFVAGVLPLAISTGAGANSRISIGTAIIGGTLTATVLAIFFVPLFFIIVRYLFNKKEKKVDHV